MAEIAKWMFALGGLRRKPVAPDARDLRYKLLRVFRKALAGAADAGEIERLLQSIPLCRVAAERRRRGAGRVCSRRCRRGVIRVD